MFNPSAKNSDKFGARREVVFLVLSGVFVGTLAMLNILGITRLLDLSFTIFNINVPFKVFVGVLPYPITFLCTDLISEFYGRKRANMVVWVGFLLNIWVIFILWIGGVLPPVPEMDPENGLPYPGDPNRLFFEVRKFTFSATAASMVAYLTAQFIDVHLFHYLKQLSKGKMLWLRNNGSTITSQMVDSFAVVLITYFFTHAIVINDGESVAKVLTVLVLSNYFFKMIAAFADTIPFYLAVNFLSKYLDLDPLREFKEKH